MQIHSEILSILNEHQLSLTPDEIARLIEEIQMPGHMIAAIKLFREQTGVQLREAIYVVDQLWEALQES